MGRLQKPLLNLPDNGFLARGMSLTNKRQPSGSQGCFDLIEIEDFCIWIMGYRIVPDEWMVASAQDQSSVRVFLFRRHVHANGLSVAIRLGDHNPQMLDLIAAF